MLKLSHFMKAYTTMQGYSYQRMGKFIFGWEHTFETQPDAHTLKECLQVIQSKTMFGEGSYILSIYNCLTRRKPLDGSLRFYGGQYGKIFPMLVLCRERGNFGVPCKDDAPCFLMPGARYKFLYIKKPFDPFIVPTPVEVDWDENDTLGYVTPTKT